MTFFLLCRCGPKSPWTPTDDCPTKLMATKFEGLSLGGIFPMLDEGQWTKDKHHASYPLRSPWLENPPSTSMIFPNESSTATMEDNSAHSSLGSGRWFSANLAIMDMDLPQRWRRHIGYTRIQKEHMGKYVDVMVHVQLKQWIVGCSQKLFSWYFSQTDHSHFPNHISRKSWTTLW